MKDNVFDHLIERIEPAETIAMPPKLSGTLQTIGAEEPLSRLCMVAKKGQQYRKFLPTQTGGQS